MASRIDLNIIATADFRGVQQQITQLRKTVADLNQQFAAQGGINPQQVQSIRTAVAEYEKIIHASGAFKTTMVDVADQTERFGRNLQNGKLKLGEYFRIWREGANATSGSLRELAKQQVSLQQAVVRSDPFKQGRAYVDQVRSIDEVANKTRIATEQQKLFNLAIARGGDEMIKWGKNTQWAGRQMMVGLTIPIALFGKSAAQAFIDFDKQMTRVIKVYGDGFTGASEKVSAKIRADLTELSKDIAKTYGVAVSDTVGMAAELAATGLTGSDLLNATTQATKLATLGEIDRQEAIKATISLQNVFKLNTQELTESIDFLNAVENQTSTSLQDIVDAIPKSAPVISQLGGSFKDVAVLMVAMREAGVPASEAANAVKSSVDKMINPTKKAREMLQGFGIDIEKIVSENAGNIPATFAALENGLSKLSDLQRSRAIAELFGTYQYARLSALLSNINREGSQTATVFKLMGASAADMASLAQSELDALANSVSGRYQRAIEGLKAAILPFGERMLQFITPVIEGVAKVADFINNNPFLQNIVTWGAALLGVVGPVIMTVGVFGNFIGYLLKGFAALKNLKDGFRSFAEIATPESIAAAKAGELFQHSLISQSEAANILTNAIQRLNAQLAQYQNLANRPGGPPPPPRPGGRPSGGPGGGFPPPPYSPVPTDVVVGPGGPTSDVIPAMLSDGEAVLTAEAAENLGRENILALNGGRAPADLPLAEKIAFNLMNTPFPGMGLAGKSGQYHGAEMSHDVPAIIDMMTMGAFGFGGVDSDEFKRVFASQIRFLEETGQYSTAMAQITQGLEEQVAVMRENGETEEDINRSRRMLADEMSRDYNRAGEDAKLRSVGIFKERAEFTGPAGVPLHSGGKAALFQQVVGDRMKAMAIPQMEGIDESAWEQIADEYVRRNYSDNEEAISIWQQMTIDNKKELFDAAQYEFADRQKAVMDYISQQEESDRKRLLKRLKKAQRKGGSADAGIQSFMQQYGITVPKDTAGDTTSVSAVKSAARAAMGSDARFDATRHMDAMLINLDETTTRVGRTLNRGILSNFIKSLERNTQGFLRVIGGPRIFNMISGIFRAEEDQSFKRSSTDAYAMTLGKNIQESFTTSIGQTRGEVSKGIKRTIARDVQQAIGRLSTTTDQGEIDQITRILIQNLQRLEIATEQEIAEIVSAVQRAAVQVRAFNPDVAYRTSTGGAARPTAGNPNPVPPPRRRAMGGMITGPGGPKDDRIPAMLSNGEFVVSAKGVSNVGRGFLDAINSGKFVMNYAEGTPPAWTPSGGSFMGVPMGPQLTETTDQVEEFADALENLTENAQDNDQDDDERRKKKKDQDNEDDDDRKKKRGRFGGMGAFGVGMGLSMALPLIEQQLGGIDNQMAKTAMGAAQFASMGFMIAGPWGAAIGALVGGLKSVADQQAKVANGFAQGFRVAASEAEMLGIKLRKVAQLDIELYNDQVAVSSSRVQELTDKIVALPEEDPLQMFTQSLKSQETEQAVATLQQKYLTLRIAGVKDDEARSMVRAIMRAAGVEGAMGNISLAKPGMTRSQMIAEAFRNAPETFNVKGGFTDLTQMGISALGTFPSGAVTNIAAGNNPIDYFRNRVLPTFGVTGAMEGPASQMSAGQGIMQQALQSFASEDMHSFKNNLMFFGPEFDKIRKSIEATSVTLNDFILGTDATKLYDEIKKLESGMKDGSQESLFFQATVKEMFNQMGPQGQEAYEYMKAAGTSVAGMLEAVRAVQIGAVTDLETAIVLGEEKLHKLYLRVAAIYEKNKKMREDYKKAVTAHSKQQAAIDAATAAANEAARKATEARNKAIDKYNEGIQKQIEIEEKRIEALQKEKEERQKILDRIKKALDYEKMQLSLRNQMREALASGNLLKFAELQQQSRVAAANRNADVQTDKFNDKIDGLIEEIRLLIAALKRRTRERVEAPEDKVPRKIPKPVEPKPIPIKPEGPLEGPEPVGEPTWFDTLKEKFRAALDLFWPDNWQEVFDKMWPDDWSKVGDMLWPDNLGSIFDGLWPDDWSAILDKLWPDNWDDVKDKLWPDDLSSKLDALWPDNWEQVFDNIWPDDWGNLFSGIWTKITGTVSGIADTVWKNVTSKLGLPENASFIDIIFAILHKLYDGIENIKSVVDKLWDNINQQLGLPKGSGIIQWINAIFKKFIQFNLNLAAWAKERYAEFLKSLGLPDTAGLWDIVKRVAELMFEKIESIEDWAQTKYKEFLKSLGLPEDASIWDIVKLPIVRLFENIQKIGPWAQEKYKEFLKNLGLPEDASVWDIVKLPVVRLFEKIKKIGPWVDARYKEFLRRLGLPEDASVWDILKLPINRIFNKVKKVGPWAENSYRDMLKKLGLPADASVWDILKLPIQIIFNKVKKIGPWAANIYTDMLKKLGLPADASPLDIIKAVIGKLFSVTKPITDWARSQFDEVKENMGLPKDATVMDVITAALETFFGGGLDIATWVGEKIAGEGNVPNLREVVMSFIDQIWPDTWDIDWSTLFTTPEIDIAGKIKDYIFGWFTEIKDAGGPLPWIKSKLNDIGIADFAFEIWNKIKGFLGGIASSGPITWITNQLNTIFTVTSDLATELWKKVSGFIGGIASSGPVKWVQDQLATIFTQTKTFGEELFDKIKQLLGPLFSTNIGSWVTTRLGEIFTQASTFAEDLFIKIKAFLGGSFSTNIGSWVTARLNEIFTQASTFGESLFIKIKSFLGGAFSEDPGAWVNSKLSDIFNQTQTLAGVLLDKIGGFVGNLTLVGNSIREQFNSFILGPADLRGTRGGGFLDKVKGMFKSLIQNLINHAVTGINAAISWYNSTLRRGPRDFGYIAPLPRFVLTLAEGGPVLGAGTSTSDSIPAMLSNGEFVMRAAAVNRYGLEYLSALNSMQIDQARFGMGGMAKAYAMGGPVYSIPQTDGTMVSGSTYSTVNNTFHITGDNPKAIANEVIKIMNEQQRRTGVFNRV